MIIKDRLLLTAASLVLGWLLLDATTMSISSATLNSTLVIDTIKRDTIQDISGKRALFIGDSHTSADYGWQYQLCKKTQMKYFNTAVGGKQTTWMIEVAKLHINSGYDYCFIYGGANDMAGNRAPIKSVRNIQKIVNMCLEKQVTPIVLTGFDPLTCVVVGSRESYKMYPSRYAKFQQLLVDSIKGAIVLKTHCISRTDCGDFLCHMTASGHKKMASFITLACRFKTY
jgi:hypothetical protein